MLVGQKIAVTHSKLKRFTIGRLSLIGPVSQKNSRRRLWLASWVGRKIAVAISNAFYVTTLGHTWLGATKKGGQKRR